MKTNKAGAIRRTVWTLELVLRQGTDGGAAAARAAAAPTNHVEVRAWLQHEEAHGRGVDITDEKVWRQNVTIY